MTHYRLKQVLYLLAGILLLTGSYALVLTKSGKQLQQTLFGRYVAEEATVDSIFTEEYELIKRTDYIHEWRVYLRVHYVVDNNNYFSLYIAKSFSYYTYKEAKRKANIFARDFIKTGEQLTIYRDPKKPQESVLYREDELHLWLSILIVLFSNAFSIALIVYGYTNLATTKKPLLKR